jgi:D-proline reductase (dithiol) PrdB
MTQDTDTAVPAAEPSPDGPVPYLARISQYYQTLGFGAPYRWAQRDEVAFAPLAKPLAQCRVGLITTAAPFQPDKGEQGPGAPYNAAAKFFQVYSGDTAEDPDLRISHIAYDRQHTAATDQGSWFPLQALRRAQEAGLIGAVAPRFHGAPTNRSHRTTLEVDGPALLARCREDAVDCVVLAAV